MEIYEALLSGNMITTERCESTLSFPVFPDYLQNLVGDLPFLLPFGKVFIVLVNSSNNIARNYSMEYWIGQKRSKLNSNFQQDNFSPNLPV